MSAPFANDLREALGYLRRNPADVEALSHCTHLLQDKGRFGDLVRLYEELALMLPRREAARMLVQAGGLWRNRLGNREGARQDYLKSLKFNETEEALSALAEMAEESRNWWDAAWFVQRLAEITEDGEARAKAFERAAAICEQKLRRKKKAADLARRAFLSNPSVLVPFESEVRLRSERGDWAEITRTLEALEDISPGPEILSAAYLTAGNALVDAPLQSERALDCIARLEELGLHAEQAAELKARIENERAESEKKIKVLRDAAINAQNKQEATRCYLKVADLYMTPLGDKVRAVENVERALLLSPGHMEAVLFLERLYSEEERFEDLVLFLEKVAAGLLNDEDRIDVHLKLAMLCAAHLGDYERAKEHYRAALTADPAAQEAVRSLKEHLLAEGAMEEAVELLRKAANAAGATVERISYLKDAAALLRDSNKRQAIELYEDALEHDPFEEDALEALLGLYRDEGMHREYASLLAKAADMCTGEERKNKLLECARVLEGELGDLPGAFDMLAKAFLEFPRENGFRKELARLADKADRIKDLARLYEDGLAGADKDEHWLELVFELAELYKARLEDYRKAEEWYKRILEYDPGSSRAFSSLVALYQLGKRWTNLAELLETRAGALETEDASEAAGLWKEAAGVYSEYLRASSKAIGAVRKALMLNPGDREAEERLLSLLLSEKNWKEYVGYLRKKAEAAVDPAERISVYKEILQALEREGGDQVMAADVAARLVDLAPEDIDALLKLAGYLKNQGKWSDYASTLERAVDLAGERGRDTADLEMELASVLEWQLEAPSKAAKVYASVIHKDRSRTKALEALERLLEVDDAAGVAADALEPIYEESQDWSRLLKVLKVKLHGLSGRARSKLQKRISKIAEDKLQRVDEAFDGYAAAFEEDPDNDAARDELVRVASETGRWPELAELLLKASADTEDAERTSALKLEAAKILVHHLGRLERAVEIYRELYRELPDDENVVQGLTELYGRLDMQQELAALLVERAGRVDDPEAAAELLVQAADLYEEKLDDAGAAAKALESVLELKSGDRDLLARLARLYERGEDWQGLERVIGELIDMAADDAERIAMELMLGQLKAGPLGEPDAAMTTFAGILERDPSNEDALSGLEEFLDDAGTKARAAELLLPCYLKNEEWSRAVEALEISCENASDREHRKSLLDEIADIYGQKLNRRDMQLVYLLRAVREMPEDENTRAKAESLAADLGAWDEVAAAYEDLLEGAQGDLWAELRASLARIYSEGMGNDEKALEQLRALLATDPTRKDLRSAEIDLLRKLGWFEDLADALEAEASRAEDEGDLERRKEVLLELGSVARERLGDLPRAIEAYDTLAGLMPEDRAVALTRISLFREAGRWESLVTVLREQAEATDDQDMAVAHRLDLAEILERELGRPNEAITVYARLLQNDEPPPEAISALERLLQEDATRKAAAMVLGPYYERIQDWRRRIEALEVLVEEESDPEERKRLLIEVASLYEQRLESPALAFVTLCRPFREEPADEDLLNHLSALAEESGQEEEFAALLEEVIAAGDLEPEKRTALAFRLASLQADKLDDREAAKQTYRNILEWEPGNADAVCSLAELSEKGGDWRDVAETLEMRVRSEADPSEKVEILVKLAQVRKDKLEDLEGAAAAYEQALEVVPEDTRVMDELIDVYEDLERWEELAELLPRRIAPAAGEERLDLELFLGRILEEELEDYDKAVELYTSLLDRHPGNEDAIEALDDLMKVDGVDAEKIADVLDPIYVARSRWDKLISNYEVRLSKSKDPAVRLECYKAMAEICEKEMNQPSAAFYILSRAYGEGFQGRDVEGTLYRLAEETGKVEELAKEMAMSAEEKENPEERAGMYRRLGKLHREKLGDVEQAATYLDMAAELKPDDDDVLFELVLLHEELGNWKDWVEVQKRRIELREAASAHEEDEGGGAIEDEAGGEEGLGPDMEGDGSDAPEAAEIQALTDADGAESVELEGAEEETLEDLYLDTASVLKEKLEDLDAAVELLERARAGGVATDAVEEELAEYLIEAERWEALTALLEEMAAEKEPGPDLAAVYMNLAKLYKNKIGDPDRALDRFILALEADPKNIEALQETASFLDDDERKTRAAAVIVEKAGEVGAWRELARALEVEIESAVQGPGLVELLKKAASVHEKELDEPEVAFAYMGRAFRADPVSDELLAEVERLAASTEGYEIAAGLFEEMAERLEFEDRAAAVKLFVKAADLYVEKLALAEQAAACYRRVLDVDPEHARALKGLVKVCRAREAWEDLADALSRTIAAAAPDEELPDLIFELGQLYEKHLGDIERARENYEQVLSLDPGHKGALDALEGIYESLEEWGPMFEIFEKAREHVSDEQDKIDLTAKMADLAGEELDMKETAIELWKEVLEHDPEDPDALEALEELYMAVERWQDLVEIYRKRLQTTVEDEEKVQIFTKLGFLRTEKVKDLEQAKTDWICVLRFEPNNLTALAMLKEVYEEKEEWEDLAAILKRLCSLQKNDEVRKNLYLKLAWVNGEKLGRRQDAIAAAKEVLELDPLTEEELDELADIFLDNEAWDEAAGVLSRRLELAEDESEQIEIRRRIAEMWRERASDPVKAAYEYERILDAAPSNEEAFLALDEIYRSRRDWKALASVFETRGAALSEAGMSPEDVKLHYRDLAELYEKKLEDPASAMAAWRRILEVAPQDAEARANVEKLASQTGGFEELAESLAKLIQEADSPKAAVGMRLTRARILKDELSDPEGAQDEYEAVVAVDPANKEALEELAAILERKQDYEGLAEVLVKWSRADESRKAELLSRAAEVYESRLEDIDKATSLRRDMLELGGEAAKQALDELERSLTEAEKFEVLASVLEEAVGLAPDKGEERARIEKLAKLYEKSLKQPDKAIDKYKSIIKEQPRYRPAWKALERLYHKEGRWRELIEVYNKLVTLAEEDGERVELYANAAAIWEEEFGERVMAVESLKKILALDPANIGAVTSLERLYRQGEEWARLIEIYHKHIALSDDTSEIVKLYNKIGEVYENDLDRPDRAVDAYSQAVNFDPRNEAALSALARLYERAGRWERAIEMLERHASAVDEPEEKTELLYRAGRIFETQLSDSRRAKIRYKQALDASPGHLPSLRALKSLAAADGDWDAYLPLLIQEEKSTEAKRDKAGLLVEIGRFYMERRRDKDSAIEKFEAALEVEPEFEEAMLPLSELYFESGRLEEARPLLESVLAGMGDDAPFEDKALILYRLGYVAEMADELDEARDYYSKALDLEPSMVEALDGVARVYYAEEKWEEARAAYEEILEKYSRGRTEDESLDLCLKLGDVYFKLARMDDAAALYGRALRIDRKYKPALRAMVEVSKAREDWEEVINYQEQLVELADDDSEKLEILLSMGDVYRDRLEDPYEAIDTYNQALAVSDQDFEVNNRLYRMFRETGQWQEAARVLERVLENEDDDNRIVVFKQALGEIYYAKLDELEKAATCFSDILEIDPTKDEALEALEDLLEEQEDWAALEAHYRRMIKLLPKKERARRIEAWKKLGELYGLRLGNLEGAIMAFEVLTKLEPDNQKHLETLAELYSGNDKFRSKAIEAYQQLAKVSAVPVLPFRALRRLYAEAKEFDKVFCLCATLRFLKEATTEEETFYRKFLPKAKMKTLKVVNEDSFWNHLVHEAARSPASKIFGFIYKYAGQTLAPGTKMAKVRKKDRIDPNDSLLFFCKMLNYVAKVLGIDRPELYRTELQAKGIGLGDGYPPALLLGEDMFKDVPKRDLWYLIARNLVYTRPEFVLARILPPDALRSLFAAVVTSFLPNAPAEADPREIERWQRKLIRHLPGEVQDYLLELSREYVRDVSEPFDAHEWLEAVDYTANRAGFVVCNDLEVAMKQLVARKDPAATVPNRALVRDLVHYSVSEDYFTLRERLGFSILA